MQQICFTGNLDETENITRFLINQEVKESILDFEYLFLFDII